ncbi:MAG: hypothetical protein NE330_12170 [Lentisphaeraceae bacterium]|nr:hypothetical protein [Lentisphaeraceae bacterium]
MKKQVSKSSNEDLYRGGNQTENKMQHIRTPQMVKDGICKRADISITSGGLVGKLSGGLSVYNRTHKDWKFWYRIPKQKLPVGLVATWAGHNNEIPSPGTHYYIEPLYDMPLTEYKRLLSKINIDSEPIRM